MKNIIKYLLIFTVLSCKSQIVPLSSYDYPNGSYVKDIDNELDYYVGTWKGVLNNIEYTFEFVKFTHHLNSYTGTATGTYHYEDELKGKLKVIDLQTNQVLYNNLNSTNYEDYLILGLAKKNGMFNFWYKSKADKCFLDAEFVLKRINGQPNQLNYCYFTLNSYRDFGCNYLDINQIPIFLPKQDLIITKQ